MQNSRKNKREPKTDAYTKKLTACSDADYTEFERFGEQSYLTVSRRAKAQNALPSFYSCIFTYLSSQLSIYRSDAEENTVFSPYTHNTFPQYCDMYWISVNLYKGDIWSSVFFLHSELLIKLMRDRACLCLFSWKNHSIDVIPLPPDLIVYD